MIVKMIGVLEECSEAERSQNDNLLIPHVHMGKSSDNLLDRSLARAFNVLLRRFIRIRGAYRLCRRLCARLCLVQGLRFPVIY